MSKEASATLIAAVIAAVVSVITLAGTLGIGYWQSTQLRKDTFQLAASERRLEAAQGYYRITFRWMRNQNNLDKLKRIEKELDEFHQSHALYLTTEGRKRMNVIITSMWSITRPKGKLLQNDDLKQKVLDVSKHIPSFHEELIKSVWLEMDPRDSELYKINGL
ncbi:hypothetical protein [Geobacter sp. DSM 9736]|uniref:hypothetical protein n=1 Tax=Geobacter sp. DSM 9736 TaxID=1277350 RepID=UPI000B509EA5|nr:hypothetical protein [Geobacter sp. DSM 9736]SNB47825.1 hypothetical protein SAMN06269301_3319 [Geobacter sp. DSM 9736]